MARAHVALCCCGMGILAVRRRARLARVRIVFAVALTPARKQGCINYQPALTVPCRPIPFGPLLAGKAWRVASRGAHQRSPDAPGAWLLHGRAALLVHAPTKAEIYVGLASWCRLINRGVVWFRGFSAVGVTDHAACAGGHPYLALRQTPQLSKNAGRQSP